MSTVVTKSRLKRVAQRPACSVGDRPRTLIADSVNDSDTADPRKDIAQRGPLPLRPVHWGIWPGRPSRDS
jgi:hypothetical protein